MISVCVAVTVCFLAWGNSRNREQGSVGVFGLSNKPALVSAITVLGTSRSDRRAPISGQPVFSIGSMILSYFLRSGFGRCAKLCRNRTGGLTVPPDHAAGNCDMRARCPASSDAIATERLASGRLQLPEALDRH